MMTKQADKQLEYERWVEEYSTELYRFAYRLSGRADVAEDLAQETFYHAWRSYGSLRDPRRARAWLYQILRHRYSHWVRTDTRRVSLGTPLSAVADPMDDAAEAPLDVMERSELLHSALGALDERYRLPFLLVFMEGMTCREAAEHLDIPLGTVLSRIHRARKSLRAHLGQLDEAAEETGRASSNIKVNTSDHDTTPKLRFGGEA